MYYITKMTRPREFRQMSFDDFFSGGVKENKFSKDYRYTNDTRTVCVQKLPEKILEAVSCEYLTSILTSFNERWKEIVEKEDKSSLYYSFKIPKHSGGLRQIDAPLPALKAAQNDLKDIFTRHFHALYHTCAFAYIPGRSSLTALQRHQYNNSRFFLKEDCHDFFGSTTFDFVIKQLSHIFPFCIVLENPRGKEELSKAISVCFLNNSLPQGTPISPMLTNLIMIPIDYEIAKYIRDNNLNMIYTRYADDMLFSKAVDFNNTWRDFRKSILNIFKLHEAPYTLNAKKTRYGSSAGRNWNLGLMLNKDNEITVGHQKKKQLKVMLYSLLTSPKEWSASDAQSLQGTLAYHLMVEKDYTQKIVKQYEEKYGNGLTVAEALKKIINNQ